jgi:hypothetical protein
VERALDRLERFTDEARQRTEVGREREQGAIPVDDALLVAVADEGFEPP